MFLSTLGDDDIVQPILSSQKKQKGRRETLKESLHTLENLKYIAQSQPVSPRKFQSRDQSQSFMSPEKENDDGKRKNTLKIVNDYDEQQSITDLKKYEIDVEQDLKEENRGFFTSIRDAINRSMFGGESMAGTPTKAAGQFESPKESEVTIIEQKSSDKAEDEGKLIQSNNYLFQDADLSVEILREKIINGPSSAA